MQDEGLDELRTKLGEAGVFSCDVDNITPDVVKKAVMNLKQGKTDVSGDYCSDALLNAPDNLFGSLSTLYQTFFIHEDFTFEVLCIAFMPLVKSALKCDTKSSNYRAIAISSLLLKVLDNVIIILYGDKLSSDFLQFGYKKAPSGTQCSWMMLEVVSYYKRHNTSVQGAFLDCSKAFDNCIFSTIFTKVLNRGVPAIIVRGLLSIYQKQKCWVRWSADQTCSHVFGVTNGTRQGSCLSPCLFAVYLDDLLLLLRNSGVGCHVGDVFAGAGCFADDLALLAPTRDGLQVMLTICENYAKAHNLTFSTDPDPKKSKSKCIFFHGANQPKPSRVILCGSPLEWVPQADHLGHTLLHSGSQDIDCNIARGSYIGTSNEILNLFKFASPEQKLVAIQIYACSWYGSNLWHLKSESALKAFRAWNTTIKMSHSLPRQTRTYLVDHLLSYSLPSVQQLITRRFVQFVQTLTSSSNPVIWQLANLAVTTVRSTTGRNVSDIREEYGLDPLVTNKRHFFSRQADVPEGNEENIELLDYLLYFRSKENDADIVSELNDIIFDICTK